MFHNLPGCSTLSQEENSSRSVFSGCNRWIVFLLDAGQEQTLDEHVVASVFRGGRAFLRAGVGVWFLHLSGPLGHTSWPVTCYLPFLFGAVPHFRFEGVFGVIVASGTS